MLQFHSVFSPPRFLRLLGLALAFALTAPALTAQIGSTGSRGIAGSVKRRGEAVTNQRIEVILLNGNRQPIDKVFADSLGNFQFLGLPAGAYIVVVEESGFRRVEESVEIPPRSTVVQRRHFTLEPLTPAFTPTAPGNTVSADFFLVPADARKSFEKGEKDLTRRNYDSALQHFDRAISLAPTFAEAHAARGTALLQKNDLPAARSSFEKAITANPQLPDAHIGLGAALVRENNFTAAVEPLSRGLQSNPGSYLGLFERCRAYLNLKRLDDAEKDCLAARALRDGDRPELFILMGNLYMQLDRKPEALREFETYLRGDSASPTATHVRRITDSLRSAGVRPAPKPKS